MPRKAKIDVEVITDNEKKKLTSTPKKATTKKAVEKKAISEKTTSGKAVVKKVTDKKNATKKTTTAKTAVKKATSKSKKSSSRKVKKISVPSLATRRKAQASKSTNRINSNNNFANILEYYDLPYRYNETVVKILAQTPKVLFVYWDISDDDRKKFEEKYGKYFFNDTYPVLIIHNKTLNYYQEVEINDFANSWYISIPDSRSEYSVELGRRFKEYVRRNPDMPHKEDIDSIISVTYSNDLIMPNDHVLLDEIKPKVKYRNVKTNEEYYKDIKQILANNKLIDFYKLYKEIYKVEDLASVFSLSNPSSGNPTSTFK